MTTSSLLDRWPALGRLSDGLSPGRWAATFFAVALGQFVFWLALLHLLVGDRERVERLMYFTGFTLLPLASVLITWGGAWLAQRRGADLTAFSDGLIAFNLGLALVAGLLVHGEFLQTRPNAAALERLQTLLSDHPDLPLDLAQAQAGMASAAPQFPPLLLLSYSWGLAWTLLRVVLKLQRRWGIVGLWPALVLPLVLAWQSLSHLEPLRQQIVNNVRVSQSHNPEVSFRWTSHVEGCLNYVFSAEGAQAIWLGPEGLAHVQTVNEGQTCRAMPSVLRVVTDAGQEAKFIIGPWYTASEAVWLPLLLSGLALPILSLASGMLGSLAGWAGLLLLLFGRAFLPPWINIPPIIVGATLVAMLLVIVNRRGGRWFDLAFGLLIVGLTVNLGFVYDQFHYHSGWMATINAMLHGQTLMVDVFSQRGLLSMVTLAGVFSLMPLHYGSLSLLISGLIAAQLMAMYGLLTWARVGRWWAACAVLGAAALYLYFTGLSPIRQPGFSPLRLGHIFLLALAVGWRLRTGRRAAQWAEWAVLVFCVLWSLDSAVIVLAGYGVLLVYEAYYRHGLSRTGALWLLRRVLLLVALISGALGLIHLWLWLSTGQVPRWDFYWGFYVFHETHRNYSAPILFEDSWWLNIVPQFAALLVLAWRALTGRSAATWRSEALIALIAAGGVIQFYHYISQSLYAHNHSVPAAVSLAYIGSLLPWGKLGRGLGLGLVGLVWAFYGPNIDPGAGLDSPPLAAALARMASEALQGQRDTLAWVEFRWGSFDAGQYNNAGLMIDSPTIREALALIRRTSPHEERLNLYLGRDTWQTLFMLRAAHRYPFSFPPHDSRIEALAQQIASYDGGEAAGDMLYLSPTGLEALPPFWSEIHPITPLILDRLCRQFDFELVEASEHGVLAIRLQESRGENVICEEYGLFQPHPQSLSILERDFAALTPNQLAALTPNPSPEGRGELLPSPLGGRAGDEGQNAGDEGQNAGDEGQNAGDEGQNAGDEGQNAGDEGMTP